jgi:hypothetical protein
LERQRRARITGGFDCEGHRYQSGELHQRNRADATQAANTAIIDRKVKQGDLTWQDESPPAPFYFISATNERVPMDAYQMRGLGQMLIRWKQHHIQVARNLKDARAIPPEPTSIRDYPFLMR